MTTKVKKSESQLKDLEYWLNTRDSFRVQVNFFVDHTPDHICVTISGATKRKIANLAIEAIKERIEFLKNKQ